MEDATLGSRAVRARHAASLIVLREGRGGAEVLMGRRSAGHRFMPNRLAFPGGRVERGDFLSPAASDPDPATRTMLEKAARSELARALAQAAARELEEETGLSLGVPPALAGLSYLCRAITPRHFPLRYHARFLIVPAAALGGRLAGSGELEALGFHGLGDPALGALPWITGQVLHELAAWLELPAMLRRSVHPTAVFREQRREEE